ncbi:hypothetical protein HanXRQr2_Chr04g0180961 [Helianthus annuus]|uniref:Uncharacterized protein n=1 Tax=Helianthus annuus TaxID=4232 RepID=A0A9K3NTI8_HELAN|nr:hypothetical protein HanXRQr2_Chr04g0180961 [Helianthus annuus]KAJ0932504.1 hypothetical protein HanPSC8_Chr04g0174371 [Helianthus annuus]
MGFLMVQPSWVLRFSSWKPVRFRKLQSSMERFLPLAQRMEMRETWLKQPLYEKVRLLNESVV